MEASLLLFADDTGLAVNTWDNLQNTISEFCELQQIVKKERLETRNDNFFIGSVRYLALLPSAVI